MSADKNDTRRPEWVLLVVGIGTLLSAMAGFTVSLALPSLGRELGIDLARSGWVLQGYLLVVTALLLVAGRLADMLGHRRIYLAGFALFGAASALCGLAEGFTLLLAARVLQGIGGALMMAASPALLTTAFPPERRGRALGLLATATYTGLTIGPPVGGLIISTLGWRWVFFLNVPAAIVVVGLGWWLLPRRQTTREGSLDWAGAALLLAGLPPLLVALSEGQRWGWSSWPTLACLGGGLGLLIVFVAVERSKAHPLLDLSLLRRLPFSAAAASAVCNYIALFVPIVLLPFYLEHGRQMTTSSAGLVLAIQPLIMALVASPAGTLSDRVGVRPLATGGMLIMAVALVGVSTLSVGSSTLTIAIWLVVLGLGTGTFISPNSSALMGAAPEHQQGVAGGVLAVSRSFGMLVGVAMASAVYHGSGGQSELAWTGTDVDAFATVLWVAASVALLGAGAAAVGQRRQMDAQP